MTRRPSLPALGSGSDQGLSSPDSVEGHRGEPRGQALSSGGLGLRTPEGGSAGNGTVPPTCARIRQGLKDSDNYRSRVRKRVQGEGTAAVQRSGGEERAGGSGETGISRRRRGLGRRPLRLARQEGPLAALRLSGRSSGQAPQ